MVLIIIVFRNGVRDARMKAASVCLPEMAELSPPKELSPFVLININLKIPIFLVHFAINGNSFLLELPFCNTQTFQIFLNEFSKENPTELKVIVLDNGPFHKSKSLIIPGNIILIFLPPYSPEINPAEKYGGY